MKSIAKKIWTFISPVVRNKYLVAIIVFLMWVTIFDTYNLIDRYSNLNKLNNLKKEREFFKEELIMYKSQYKDLFSGKDELEKYAREQYLMKKPNEDVYVVIFE